MMKRRVAVVGVALAPVTFAAGCGSVELNAPEKTTTVAGPAGRLYLNDGGTGPRLPVLLVHGFAGSSEHWQDQLRYLRETRRAAAFDLRGHGRSDSPGAQSAYSIEAMAGDVGAVADALALRRFVLVGHSMGGAVAAAYAALQPQRVAGLVLVGAGGRIPAEHSMPLMQALRADYAKTMNKLWDAELAGARPENAALLRRQMQRVPRETGLALFGSMLSFDPNRALQAYPGPKLLIDPERDRELHEQQPQIPRRVIAGTSHWPQLDKPREVNAILGDFLAGVQTQIASSASSGLAVVPAATFSTCV